jgi:hypothetical protein
MPLAAAGGTLTAVAVIFCVFLPRLNQHPAEVPDHLQKDVQVATEAGQRALAEGNFFIAARELKAAAPHPGDDRAPAELRRLEQLRRQADLLARLHGRSLQEVLGEALPLRSDEEWKGRFHSQHLGKGVIFDDVVSIDRAGRPTLAVYRVSVGGESARVALEDLRLLRRLPLDVPQRIVFGGQLSDLWREDGGGWAFRFDPDSGVLLTDVGAVAACLGPPDSELLAVLRRQQQWLADLAAPGQAR